MKRKHKKYKKPRKAYEKARIEEENQIIKKYGLKNKREIWKAEAFIDKIRRKAKELITASEKERENFVNRLKNYGFNVEKIADVLSLDKENLFKRRLQTILAEKKLARSVKHARQLITHKHVLIENKAINIPSYIVPIEKENLIRINISLENKKPEEKPGEKND